MTLGGSRDPEAARRASYARDGFVVVRDLIAAVQVDDLAREADRLWEIGSAAGSESGPLRWLRVEHAGRPAILRGVQPAHRAGSVLDRLRTAREVQAVLKPWIGKDIDTVACTLFWKEPGQPATGIGYHQDAAFRRPVEKFRNLSESYVQMGVAIDPHRPENGGMRFIVGSHLLGDLQIKRDSSVLAGSADVSDLTRLGLSDADGFDVCLNPGDAVFWHPYLLHGSPPNRSATLNRRFVAVGYIRAADCDVGDPAFRGGEPRPLAP